MYLPKTKIVPHRFYGAKVKIQSMHLILTLLGGAVWGSALAAENPATVSGELAFYRNCGSCHSIEKGKNLIGPSLHLVFGRKAGSLQDYRYSDAVRKLDATWTADQLDTYLTNTQSVAPGNKMWVRFPDAKTRQEIIGFLASQSSANK